MSDTSSASNSQATEGFASWNDYWKAHGAPWRTEPEIDEARQTYLAERRAIQPDIERGIYSFKDIALTRADVEWLLATHESSGMRGPVNWHDEQQQSRVGIDLRGALLCGVDLQGLPLARIRAGLTRAERAGAPLNQREEASAHLERAQLDRADLRESALYHAHLEHASLREAHLEGAILEAAHLEDANLYQAHLGSVATDLNKRARLRRDQRQRLQLRPADLRRVFVNQGTNLNHVELGDRVRGFASLADIRWNGVNLAVVDWEAVSRLGDETIARTPRMPSGRRKKKAVQREEYQAAVRANRQLAVVLRNQGLNEAADRYAYRAHVCQRAVLRLRYQYSRYVGSLLLDLLAGYGYRPGRSILVYLAVILWFANFYVWASHGLFSLGLPPTHVAPLAWYEGLILSVSSFHGRGFQPFQNLSDPIAALAGMQAVLGLIIEVSFIATFTQRFFAR